MRSTLPRTLASAALAVSAALLMAACSTGSGTAGGGAPAATPSASGASGGGQTTGATPVAAPTSTGGTSTGGTSTGTADGCVNRVATPAVKAAVTKAYAAATGHTHLQPRPGQFLYGECGGVFYAATAFELTPGATYEEQVAAQDDGSVRKYFTLGSGGAWTMKGSASFPDLGGCLTLIPQQLAQQWNNCAAGAQ